MDSGHDSEDVEDVLVPDAGLGPLEPLLEPGQSHVALSVLGERGALRTGAEGDGEEEEELRTRAAQATAARGEH